MDGDDVPVHVVGDAPLQTEWREKIPWNSVRDICVSPNEEKKMGMQERVKYGFARFSDFICSLIKRYQFDRQTVICDGLYYLLMRFIVEKSSV